MDNNQKTKFLINKDLFIKNNLEIKDEFGSILQNSKTEILELFFKNNNLIIN